MRSWTRAGQDCLCGHCRVALVRGTPIQVVTMAGLTRRLVRCLWCADGLPPPDLPALMEQANPAPLPFVRFTADMLPLDFRAAAAGEREPGEEG